jgi:ATP-binding cassette subfamily B protein
VSEFYLATQQQIISDNIAGKVLTKAIELDLEYYENPAFYDELHMVQQQSVNRPAQFIAAYQGIIQNTITVILFSGFMLKVHWSVLVLVVILGFPLAISKLVHGYKQFLLDKESMPAQRKATDLFHYLTSDIYAKEVRVFNFGSTLISRFLNLRKFVFKKKRELHYKFLKQNVLIQFFEIIVVTVIYCIIISKAITGAITIGGLVIYFQVFQRLQGAIASLFKSCISLFQNHLYLREILKYLASPVPVVSTKTTQEQFAQISDGITVKGLSFTYPHFGRHILSDINMNFRHGQITAIVGENGSGKSTLIKLLCKFYEVDKRTVFLDGVDITEIERNVLRKNITAVFQDFGKYYLTIQDNITLGSKANNILMDIATEKAGMSDKIASFPKGYRTILGRTFKNGEQLSTGHWQKVAIARGFYKDSNILIFDEPTSSLDPIAENDIFEEIKKNIDNKIVILITHRLYNLKIADQIYVMQNGRVAESGTFDELLSGNGAFRTMYEKQAI